MSDVGQVLNTPCLSRLTCKRRVIKGVSQDSARHGLSLQHELGGITVIIQITLLGASLMLQWLEIHLPFQAMQVWSLGGDLGSHVLQGSFALQLLS